MLQAMMTVTVTRKIAEAIDIATFELADPAMAELPPFSAGAHIDVEIAPGLVRQYSLCNNPVERNRYVIGVLKDPASRGGSTAMHDIVEGQALRISAPRNHFELQRDVPYSLLFAGGIGITPILCMAERLAATDARFEMHYSARSRARCAFHDRIRASAFADDVRFHFDEGAPDRRLDIAAVLDQADRDAHIYVCGPAGFIDFVVRSAAAAGFPDGRVHREYFKADADALLADGEAFQLKLASSGRVLDIPADRTVLQILQENGIELPVSCEQGVCGTCITRVIEGVPDHRDMYLNDAEHAANDQFTPCCSRSRSPLLVIDI